MGELRPRRVMCWFVAFVAALAVSDASAQVSLSWQAPGDAQCSSGEQIRDQVSRLSDQPVTLDTPGASYRIEAVVAPNAQSWEAAVRMLDPRGQTVRSRTVVGRTPSCGSIDVAAAVVIATMLDSLRVAAPRAEVPPPSAAGPSLAAFAAVNSELVPEAWLGGGLALELGLGSAIQLTVSASAYAPGEQRDARGRGARAWGFHAGAALCPAALRSDLLDLHVCAGVQGGAVLASGVGLTRTADASVPLAFALAGPKLTLKLTRTFAAQLTAAAAWAFVRPKIVWSIEGEAGGALTSSQIGLLAQIGITISPW